MGRFVTRCRRFPPQYERLVNLHSVLISREAPPAWPATALDPISLTSCSDMDARLAAIGQPPLGAAERDALRAQLKVSQWQPSTVKAVSETCNPERVIREAADAEYQLQFYTDQAERYASGPLNQPLLVAF